MTDLPPMPSDEKALLLALQEAQADGIPVFTRSFGMVEHSVSKRRYVVETVQLGPAGSLNLWAPVTLATAHLGAFKEAERMARSGIVTGQAVPDALANLRDIGATLRGYGPNGAS